MTMHSVLELDATLSSHPIVQTVNTPDEITSIFDAISYNKVITEHVYQDIIKYITNSLHYHLFSKS